MGKSDSFSKELLQDDSYFADTVNNTLFSGREVVRATELKELDTTELTIIEDITGNNIPIQKHRDVLKQAAIRMDSNAVYVIIGIENQTSIQYAMPVKVFLYDAIKYIKQVDKKRIEYRRTKEKLSNEEFLSGWRKSDRLIPVVTITVYFGTDIWDGPKSIHEMFEDNIDSNILDVIPNYRIHLLEPRLIENWERFKTDIGLLFNTIAVSHRRNGITNLVKENPDKFKHVDNKVVNAINFYTKSNFQVNDVKEETDMCYATKTSEASAIIQAFIKIGKNLNETLDYFNMEYPDDKDITREYVTEEYNLFLNSDRKK